MKRRDFLIAGSAGLSMLAFGFGPGWLGLSGQKRRLCAGERASPSGPQFTTLTQGGSTTDASSYTTAPITPAANELHLLFLAPTGSDDKRDFTTAPTVSGCNMTWTLKHQSEESLKRLFLFYCVPSSPTSGTLTFDFGAQPIADCMWGVVKVENAITTNGGADAFEQAVGYFSRRDFNRVLEGSGYISDFTHPDSATLCFLMGFGDPTFEAGYTEIVDVDLPEALIYLSVGVSPGYDHRPYWTYRSGADHFGYVIGIRAAPAVYAPINSHKLVCDALTTNFNNYSFPTVTVTAGRLGLAAVLSVKAGGSAGPSEVRIGDGFNFTKVTEVSLDDLTLTLWRALFRSSTSATFQVLHSSMQDACACYVMEFTGIDASGTNGTGAVVQSAADSATSTTELTLELAAFGSPNNATFAAFAQPVNYNQTYWPYAMPGPGLGVPFFNVIDPGNRGVSNPDSGLIGLFQHTPNVAPSCAFHPPKADVLGVACEIKAARAVAAEDPTPDPRKQQTVWLPLWVDD